MFAFLFFVNLRSYKWILFVSFVYFHDDNSTVVSVELTIKDHYRLETLDQLNRLTLQISGGQ